MVCQYLNLFHYLLYISIFHSHISTVCRTIAGGSSFRANIEEASQHLLYKIYIDNVRWWMVDHADIEEIARPKRITYLHLFIVCSTVI